jgi:peptide chain release factor subunit 1
MISLIIPPRDQVARYSKMLSDEFGTASNIKNRVNRQSVLTAITSTQQKLKLYNRVPDNGLVIYCGTILTDEGKEKKVNIAIEPHKPINTSLYLCDNKFHTEVRPFSFSLLHFSLLAPAFVLSHLYCSFFRCNNIFPP